MAMDSSELIFYCGIALAVAAVIIALICAAVFAVTGKRLRKRLEQEYGNTRM